MKQIAKIFLVDDHQLVLDGLSRLVDGEEDMQVLGSANDGKTALSLVPSLQPDLVLMDMDMPVMNGLEASRQLLAGHPKLRIAILTMHAERAIVERMIKLGVSGYFIKNADKDEFLMGIRLILKGKKYFQADALLGMTQKSQALGQGSSEMMKLSILSAREQEILSLIALGKTSKEIAEALFISTRTVETHRKNIHQKLEIKNLAGLIRFAIKAGLVS
ncbi:MAG: response regulator transcription factor [Bacteroidota bacterium]